MSNINKPIESITLLIFSMISIISCQAQEQKNWVVGYEIKTISLPPLQSYAAATYQDKLLLVGGRKDGLHLRQPVFAFDSTSRNDSIYLYTPEDDTYLSLSIENLPDTLRAQLSSTNPEYVQNGDFLYFIGGYGYLPKYREHITYDKLIGLHIPSIIRHIQDQIPIDNSCYFTITDSAFAVTGGIMEKYNGHYVIAGGHRFDGFYNPMGQSTFTQKYHEKILEFDIDPMSKTFDILNVVEDPSLHRRDFNSTVIQGDRGDQLILYAGVFRRDMNYPYQFLISYQNQNLDSITGFRQCLSTYHTAHTSLDAKFLGLDKGTVTIFLGGLAPYYFKKEAFIMDTDVPFVSQISLVHHSAQKMPSEYLNPISLPYFLGTGSQFFETTKKKQHGDKISLGYFIGGIKSPDLNVFWSAADSPSIASPYLVQVYLQKSEQTMQKLDYSNSKYMIDVFPDSAYTEFTAHWNQGKEKILMEAYRMDSSKVFSQMFETSRNVKQSVHLPKTLMKESQFLFHFQGVEDYWMIVMNND